jgi:hypothetical protein
MTESQWLDPQKDCGWLLSAGRDRITERKFRLFACACARVVWPLLAHDTHRKLIEIAERFADGEVSFAKLSDAHKIAVKHPDALVDEYDQRNICPGRVAFACAEEHAGYAASGAAGELYWVMDRWGSRTSEYDDQETIKIGFLRDIVGNPFQPVVIEPGWLAWNDGTVPRLAASLYEERSLPRGRIDDLDQLEGLSDALEDAGCDAESLLEHLRDPEAVHVRGCWALDLLLGKE